MSKKKQITLNFIETSLHAFLQILISSMGRIAVLGCGTMGLKITGASSVAVRHG